MLGSRGREYGRLRLVLECVEQVSGLVAQVEIGGPLTGSREEQAQGDRDEVSAADGGLGMFAGRVAPCGNPVRDFTAHCLREIVVEGRHYEQLGRGSQFCSGSEEGTERVRQPVG